ncbi:hypothetical protein [Clostridium sp. VAP52]|uniref:hypothetical protein n=1 Tax=Clostridium sp. VAP52 TaxID=2949977 RepID=UPI00207A83DD|nr:hypothetical protein [Clostridium sp. VAP52]
MKDELKFTWVDSDIMDDKVIMKKLKNLKEKNIVNYDDDNLYFIAFKESDSNIINDILKEYEPQVEDVYEFFKIKFEQCGIKVESMYGKRFGIEIDMSDVLWMLIDEKDVYYTDAIQNILLTTNDISKELTKVAENMCKTQLELILSEFQSNLKYATIE